MTGLSMPLKGSASGQHLKHMALGVSARSLVSA